MIQRIQTIYLLVAAILMALSYAFGVLIGFEEPQSKLYAQLSLLEVTGKATTYSPTPLHYALPLLTGIAVVLQCWAVFAFGNLQRQSRIVLWSILVILCYYGVLAYEYFHMSLQLSGSILPDLGAVLPTVALVFAIMALRAIRRDYKLIRSVDRIR